MNKDLKKSYQKLDLPYTATEEQVVLRKNALIMIMNGKEIDTKHSYRKEIQEIEKNAENIMANIKEQGIPNEHGFESSNKSIFVLIFALSLVALLCFFSFYILV